MKTSELSLETRNIAHHLTKTLSGNEAVKQLFEEQMGIDQMSVRRLLNAALPRIRDFQGIARNCFDGRGNCSIGIREHTIFPEIDYNSIDRIRGLQIVLVTTAKSDQEGMRFLELMGMPFVKVED